MSPFIKDTKHYIKKIIGKPDYYWYLEKFEKNLPLETTINTFDTRSWAEQCLLNINEHEKEEVYEASTDPIVRQGWKHKKEVERSFGGRHKQLSQVRILIHVPDAKLSPAGFSLFENMVEAFRFIGIATDTLTFNESTEKKLTEFKPTVFMSSDNDLFLNKINWEAIAEYKTHNQLLIGLTASLEIYGNTPLKGRLAWAQKNSVEFYYTFRDMEYVRNRPEYKPFFDSNYPIFPIPFGANPLVHYPIPGIPSDLNYSFIASTNKTKAARYYAYLNPITSKYPGFIDGPGWTHAQNFHFNRNRDRYIYARSKVGLNIHLKEQLTWANEVNERTYQLAACGVPQIIDHSKLLDSLFSPKALFIADSPREYLRHFERIMSNPEEGQQRALQAQKEVFEKYTTFHRASEFVTMLSLHFNIK